LRPGSSGRSDHPCEENDCASNHCHQKARKPSRGLRNRRSEFGFIGGCDSSCSMRRKSRRPTVRRPQRLIQTGSTDAGVSFRPLSSTSTAPSACGSIPRVKAVSAGESQDNRVTPVTAASAKNHGFRTLFAVQEITA
jgi:hypothetical protein